MTRLAVNLGLLTGLGLLAASFWLGSPESAKASVEEWFPGHSWIQYTDGQSSTIKPVGTINGSGWSTHYSNAVGSWNSHFSDDPFTAVGQSSGAQIHVVEAGSFDEAVLDTLKHDWEGYTAYNTCNGWVGNDPYVWGSVVPYSGNGDPRTGGGHSSTGLFSNFKVCIWTSNVTNGHNGNGWHYRWLTIKHELGHVLALGDDRDGDACLMKDGSSMDEICSSELNFVSNHFGRN